jgi:hypothetical protein
MQWRRTGNGCTDQRFFDLGTTWRWVVSFTPRLLYPRGKSPRCSLDRKLGGPQSCPRRYGEVKILEFARTRTPPLSHSVHSQSLVSRIFSVALGPIHPSIKHVQGVLSGRGVNRAGREADHSPPSSAEVKKTWIYTICHHGVVLN